MSLPRFARMDICDDKLARLVAELQKAVIGQELHRGRAERPARRKTRRAR